MKQLNQIKTNLIIESILGTFVIVSTEILLYLFIIKMFPGTEAIIINFIFKQ